MASKRRMPNSNLISPKRAVCLHILAPLLPTINAPEMSYWHTQPCGLELIFACKSVSTSTLNSNCQSVIPAPITIDASDDCPYLHREGEGGSEVPIDHTHGLCLERSN